MTSGYCACSNGRHQPVADHCGAAALSRFFNVTSNGHSLNERQLSSQRRRR
jgi:hypothetical protein